MSTVFDLIIYILLLSPSEIPVPHFVSSKLYAALQRVACREELASMTEPWRPSFAHEVTCIRHRLRRMVCVPRIGEVMSLPDVVVARDYVQFNRQHAAQLGEWLGSGIDLWPWPLENEGLYAAWCYIEKAADCRNNVYFRRLALLELSEMLGWPAVMEGRWPPPVPVWRFRRVE